MLSAYIQSSIAESSESDANNDLEKACDNTDHLHPLYMYPKQERLHRHNVIEEMTQSCNISSVNLYVGAKEVNTRCQYKTHNCRTLIIHHHMHTHPNTHIFTPPPHSHTHIHTHT